MACNVSGWMNEWFMHQGFFNTAYFEFVCFQNRFGFSHKFNQFKLESIRLCIMILDGFKPFMTMPVRVSTRHAIGSDGHSSLSATWLDLVM